jgi:hypothetical protein
MHAFSYYKLYFALLKQKNSIYKKVWILLLQSFISHKV